MIWIKKSFLKNIYIGRCGGFGDVVTYGDVVAYEDVVALEMW